MKHQNVKYTAIAEYSNGDISNLRAFVTYKAMSNWVNRQFAKDENVTVTVFYGYTSKIYTVYHA